MATYTYRLSPGQTLPFPHALSQGVLAADENLLGLLLTCLGLEVIFVVGQSLQEERNNRQVRTPVLPGPPEASRDF